MSDVTGTGAQMSHPAVPVVLGLLMIVGGGLLFQSGSVTSSLIVVGFGAVVLLLGVHRIVTG